MLETLIQVAKELVKFEADKEGVSEELVSTKYLCKDFREEEIKVLAINLEGFAPKVSLEDYKSEEYWKYLCAFSTGGQAIGPSAVVNLRKKKKENLEKEVQKGVDQINRALKKLRNKLKGEADKALLEDLSTRLSRNSKELMKEILNKGLGNKSLLTLEFDGKKPGEEETLRKAFIKKRLLGEERAKSSSSKPWRCGICGEQAIVRPSLLVKFFTVEKRGFAPLAMDTEAWKYAPLCEECTKWLCIAQNFLDSHLRARVAGKRAYLIPNLEPKISKMPSKFVQYLWEFRERTARRIVPKVEEFPEVGETPELANLFEDLVENYNWDGPPPFRSASLVFYTLERNKILFLYTTADILPKQLKKVSESLRNLREALRNNALGDLGARLVERGRLRGDFNFISEAWDWSVKEKQKTSPLTLNPMELVEALLTQNPPPPAIFWKDVGKILHRLYLDALTRERTIKQEISWRVALIWALWTLLYKEGGLGMEKDVVTTFESAKLSAEFWEDFFKPKKMLNTNTKRGLFLLGVLFGQVEDQQRKERNDWKGEMPILSYLRGLSIPGDELRQRLFPQLIVKLRQLSAYSKAVAEVEATASYYLSCSEGISNEEARFIFCLGWALSKHTLGLIWNALIAKEEGVRVEKEPV